MTAPPAAARLVAALAALAAILVAPAVAHAQLNWREPQVLSPDEQNADSPQVAMNNGGQAVVVWREDDNGVSRARAALRDPGQNFRDVKAISTGSAIPGTPRVAMDEQGNAWAVWSQDGNAVGSFRPAGGQFGPAQTLVGGAAGIDVAMDGVGKTVIVFLTGGGRTSASSPCTGPRAGRLARARRSIKGFPSLSHPPRRSPSAHRASPWTRRATRSPPGPTTRTSGTRTRSCTASTPR